MKIISIIIPAYNEEKNVGLIYDKLMSVLAPYFKSYRWEIFFVNDGSLDGTIDEIKKISKENQNVKYLDFSRNFNKEIAITAGINNCQGDACIMIDADLQHPVELIPKFLKKWEAGADVVVGIRKNNKSDSWFKKVGSMLFYKILNKISEIKVIPGSTDFRLLDRKVIDEFNRFTETKRMTRGLIDWLGFKRDFIYFEANERLYGKASYSFSKLISLALSSFISFSLLPLKLSGYLGIFITVVSGLAGFYILMGKYFFHWSFASTFSDAEGAAIFIIFLVGVILMLIGLVFLYVANIHIEVVKRPIYVVRERNFERRK